MEIDFLLWSVHWPDWCRITRVWRFDHSQTSHWDVSPVVVELLIGTVNLFLYVVWVLVHWLRWFTSKWNSQLCHDIAHFYYQVIPVYLCRKAICNIDNRFGSSLLTFTIFLLQQMNSNAKEVYVTCQVKRDPLAKFIKNNISMLSLNLVYSKMYKRCILWNN